MSSIFFWISKIFWLMFSPDLLLVLCILISCILLWIKAYKKALILSTILSIGVLIITVFPIGSWLLYPLENRFLPPAALPESVDGIIMLAGSEDILKTDVWKQVELGDGAERYLAFMRLVRIYPDAKAVFTGGTGELTHRNLKSTLTGKMLLKEQGLDISKIIFESNSRNTYENALFTQKMINPLPGEKWILVTSAYHMPRSVGIFSKLGWKVIPFPVDHQTDPTSLFRLTMNFSGNFSHLQTGIKAWIGLAAYYITGKTDCFFPG